MHVLDRKNHDAVILWQASNETSRPFVSGNHSHQHTAHNSSNMVTARSPCGWATSSYSPVHFGHQPNLHSHGDSAMIASTRNMSKIESMSPKQPQSASHENSSFGVGIEFAAGRRELIVSSLVPGCSAQVNGNIRVGDEMVEADGVTGLDFKQAKSIILGRQGTSVSLAFRRQGQTYRVNLIRGNIDFVQVFATHSYELRSLPSMCWFWLPGCSPFPRPRVCLARSSDLPLGLDFSMFALSCDPS